MFVQVCTNCRRSFISAGRYSTGSLWAELNESDSKTTKFNTIIRAPHWTRSCPVYLPQVLTALYLYISLGVSFPRLPPFKCPISKRFCPQKFSVYFLPSYFELPVNSDPIHFVTRTILGDV